MNFSFVLAGRVYRVQDGTPDLRSEEDLNLIRQALKRAQGPSSVLESEVQQYKLYLSLAESSLEEADEPDSTDEPLIEDLTDVDADEGDSDQSEAPASELDLRARFAAMTRSSADAS